MPPYNIGVNNTKRIRKISPLFIIIKAYKCEKDCKTSFGSVDLSFKKPSKLEESVKIK